MKLNLFALALGILILAHGANRAAYFEKAGFDFNATNDRIARIKYELGQNFELERKHGNVFELLALLLLQFVTIADEFVKQMVDDVGCEYLDSFKKPRKTKI